MADRKQVSSPELNGNDFVVVDQEYQVEDSFLEDGNQGKHWVTKRGPALSNPMFTLVTSEDIAESASHRPIQRCLREMQRQNKVLDFLLRPTMSQQDPDRCCVSNTTISLSRTLQRHGSLAISSSVKVTYQGGDDDGRQSGAGAEAAGTCGGEGGGPTCSGRCRVWLNVGGLSLSVGLSIMLYCVVYLEWRCGINDYDAQYPWLVPVAIVSFLPQCFLMGCVVVFHPGSNIYSVHGNSHAGVALWLTVRRVTQQSTVVTSQRREEQNNAGHESRFAVKHVKG
ncbi:unnamed protein product [Ranitomeya imitator]|uniref:Uncharacterized protein n=1 Tax=Ranitomeya imitator TaxID=111125 RepID=A0ABN9MCU0_9NEOB|nr:unnamed protein product [Ranitomeya imitator]